MHRGLVGDAGELGGETLDALDEERGIRNSEAMRAPGTFRERVRARVQRDREEARIVERPAQHIGAVAGADIDQDPRMCAGRFRDLTDVYVDDPLAEESTHTSNGSPLTRREPRSGCRCTEIETAEVLRCGGSVCSRVCSRS